MSIFKSLCIILFCFWCTQMAAQEKEVVPNLKQHVLHLKNGSSLIGVVLRYGEGRPAIIQMADGEKIEVPYGSIEMIQPLSQRTKKLRIRKSKDRSYAFEETGWHYRGGIGLISNGASRLGGANGITLDLGAVYHFNRMLGLGLSLGYDSYSPEGVHNYLPIQVVIEGYLSPKYVTLFYSLGAGYGIAVSDTLEDDWSRLANKGGFSLYPKLGIRLSGHEGVNTTLFTGIKIQKSSIESSWGEDFEESIIQERTFKRLIIGIGIVF